MLFRPSFEVITIGDSTLDVFLQIHSATLSCQLNKEQCLFCLQYGEKIPIEAVRKIPGAGNASNVAVGLSRFKHKTAIVSIIGNDETGQEIQTRWKEENVSQTYVIVDPKKETNYSTVLNFKGERTILVYSQPRTYLFPPLGKTHWIYYTALGPKHERLEKDLLAYLAKHPKTKLAFNPGGAQFKRGLKALTPIIARSNLFILNKQEAEHLCGRGQKEIKELLQTLIQLGPKILIITDGPNGTSATDGKTIWHCPIFPGKIIERTGAGDSFGATCIHAFLKGWTISETLRAGTANAWSVVQHIGPQKGLLTEKELKRILDKFAKIQPTYARLQ